jgi:hypothetical protein
MSRPLLWYSAVWLGLVICAAMLPVSWTVLSVMSCHVSAIFVLRIAMRLIQLQLLCVYLANQVVTFAFALPVAQRTAWSSLSAPKHAGNLSWLLCS